MPATPNPLIDIRPDHWAIVRDILQKHVPQYEVWAFGSRAKWTAKEYSDLDLAVITDQPLSLSVSAALSDDFSESDLPWKVDVVDWATTSESFRQIIERDKVVVQKAGTANVTNVGRVSASVTRRATGETNQDVGLRDKAANPTYGALGMVGEWRTATVLELQRDGVLLVEDGNHGEYRPRPDEFVDVGAAFIRAADMDVGRVLFESASRINERARKRITKGIGAPGDVLLSHKGTVGKVALVADDAPPFVCSPQTTFWRTLDQERLDRKYLYAFLRSAGFHAQLATRAGETDMAPYVSLTSQRGLSVTVPPISTQRAIAHILGTLDDKIELNRRMNETLEAMARALFKSWFVDFDPVRAKAERRDPDLPKPLADLFPNSFEDSELGEIPKGWGVKPLPEVIDVNPTRALRKGVEAPYLDMANMPTRGHSPDDVVDRPFGSGMRFMNGDTLVARITPCLENGKTAFVDFLGVGQVGWGSTEYIVLRPKPPLPEEFAYCLARSTEFRDFAIQSMTGSSGRQRVPAESLSHFRVVVAPKPIAELFGRLIKPIFARASAGTKEGRTLATLRDTLLPKLISGDLRVSEAEAETA